MNRENKFRAWDKKTNSWYDDSNQHLVISLDGTLTNCWNGELMEDYTDRIILLPLTGLKDKNGVEIYEGHIVQSTWYDVGNNPYKKKGEIIFVGAQYVIAYDSQFDVETGEITYDAHSLTYAEDVEVIGNIYENPEFLEVES